MKPFKNKLASSGVMSSNPVVSKDLSSNDTFNAFTINLKKVKEI